MEETTSISDFDMEIEIETQNDAKNIKCPNCDKIFNFDSDLEVHMKRIHLKIRDHKCEVCEKMYTNTSALNLHKTIHKAKSFPCYICDFKAYRKQGMISHIELVHLGISPKPYFCQECGKSFALKDHKRIHMDPSNLEKYPCDACGRLFGLVKNLRRHVKTHNIGRYYSNEFKLEVLEKVERLGVNETAKIVGVRDSTINGWVPILTSSPQIQNFFRWVSLARGDHLCSECGKYFTTRGALELHARRQHEVVVLRYNRSILNFY